jgi:hypothetical protein
MSRHHGCLGPQHGTVAGQRTCERTHINYVMIRELGGLFAEAERNEGHFDVHAIKLGNARASTRGEPALGAQTCAADTHVMQVLVVEDDPAVRASVAAALRREGYVVELAGDGAAALDRLVAGSFDSVVLDVLMPRLDGLEMCRRLRARGDSLRS